MVRHNIWHAHRLMFTDYKLLNLSRIIFHLVQKQWLEWHATVGRFQNPSSPIFTLSQRNFSWMHAKSIENSKTPNNYTMRKINNRNLTEHIVWNIKQQQQQQKQQWQPYTQYGWSQLKCCKILDKFHCLLATYNLPYVGVNNNTMKRGKNDVHQTHYKWSECLILSWTKHKRSIIYTKHGASKFQEDENHIKAKDFES